jgi:hypothetical protein
MGIREDQLKDEKRAERYYRQQGELPLHKRSRGWWAEIGFATVMGWVAIAAFIIAIVFLILGKTF